MAALLLSTAGMKRLYNFFLQLFFFLLLSAGSLAYAQPISDFSAGADSWSTVGKCPAESNATVYWSATGGNPSGHIYAQDENVGVFYWVALGATWKGNLSAYYGCYLLFDLKNDFTNLAINEYDVLIIKSNDSTISYNTSPNPDDVWTSYVVPLFEGSWIVDGPLNATECPDLSGTIATSGQMISYLTSVKRIRIRAEYSGLSYETNYLDNVLIDCDLLLPVNLIDFRVAQEAFGVARLSWITSTEINCREFEIQKSTDGIAFSKIGTVEGHGSSMEENSYLFYDDNFYQTSYYRLKQIDLNDDFEYSNIISLSAASQNETTTHIYPNPTANQLHIVSSYPIIGVRIMNLNGSLVYEEPVQYDSFVFNKVLQVGKLTPGIYVITIIGESSSTQQMLEVLK